jgi:hypothetical protein
MDYLTHPCYPKALLLPILIQNNTAKNMKRIIPMLSFTTEETKNKIKPKRERERERERDVKCPNRWLSPSNLMQAIFTA